MRKDITLSAEEQEQSRKWRLNKCGFDSFGMLWYKFQKEVKNKYVSRKI